MLKRLIVVCGFLGAAACASTVPREAGNQVPLDQPLRVLVFNIHAGKNAAGASNLDDVAALIRSTGADLALVQEVDRGTRRSGGIDQLQVMSAGSGFPFAFGRSLDYDGGQYGIAAFARQGFIAQFTEALPVKPLQTRAGGSHEPRAALVIVVGTRRGNLTALNTHLDASGVEGYRLQEAAKVIDLIAGARKSRMPAIAGGDFNAEPGSEVHKRILASGLRDAWMECGQGDGFTFPAHKPVKRIDYLFLTDPLHCTDARVIETTISDHRPLLVTLR
ncbi:MAG TPA: endonuclease/exonuclease/phosphatase family protein [Vicinamibacterales bacterium]|nr:endonuclease/exonuclease/phosphatase family protein [Vicinamibacterales bacterium]